MATVVLTQPALRAGPLAAHLSARGHEVVAWPMSSIEPVPDLDGGALRRRLEGCAWVLFPSPGAIDLAMAALAPAGGWPAGARIGVIGPGSRDALRAWAGRVAGLRVDDAIEPSAPPYDAQALLARPEFGRLDGLRVAVLRRDDGRRAWLDALRERGADVDAVTIYAARPLEPPAGAADWLAARAADDRGFAVSVAAADAGARLMAAVSPLACAPWVAARPVLVQHPRIAEALVRQGWRRVVPHAPGRDALTAAIESLPDHRS